MADPEREKITVDLLLLLLEQLTLEEQEQLRTTLNDRLWRKRVQQFVPDDLAKQSNKAWRHLIDRLESGDIDEDISAASGRFLQYLSDRFKGVVAPTPDAGESAGSGGSDLEIELELAYEELQTKLIPIRQALAQAIATEAHFQKLIEKNRNQRDNWLNQAAMAEERGQTGIAQQSRMRAERYARAVIASEVQLGTQSENTLALRKRLNELEGSIDDAKTRKEILIARQRAERAVSATEELLSKAKTDDLLSVISRLEQEYAELRKSAESGDSQQNTGSADAGSAIDPKTLLHRILSVLERATNLMEAIEQKMKDQESN